MLFIYSPTVAYEYNLDDKLSSGQNELVQEGFSGLVEIFKNPYLGEGDARYGGYRPIPRATYAIEYGLWGNNPHLSHLINLLIYSLCCYLVFILFKHPLFKSQAVIRRANTEAGLVFTFVGLAIFSFHPLHVEAVASLKNREVLLAFVFGMIYLFLLLKTNKNILIYFLAFFALNACLFCKLDGLIFPVFVILVYLFHRKAGWQKSIGINVLLLMASLTVNFLIQNSFPLELNLAFTPEENPLVNIVGSSAHLSTVAYISLYLSRLIFIPNQQLFFYGTGKIDLVGWDNTWVIFSVLLHISLLILALRWYFKKNKLGLFLMMYLACIGLNSNLIIPVPGIIADRLLFVIILPLALFSSHLLWQLFNLSKSKKMGWLASIPIGLLVISSCYFSKTRVPCWERPFTLGQCDMKQLNNSIIAQTIYVKLLSTEISHNPKAEELHDLALAHCRRILEINPQSVFALDKIGNIFCEYKDSVALGSKILLEALKIAPHRPETLRSMGNCFSKAGDSVSALKFYHEASKNAAFDIDIKSKIFNIHLFAKQIDQAEIVLGEMLAQAPNNKTTQLSAGMLDIAKGDPKSATKKFEALVKKHPEMTELNAMIRAYYESVK